MVAWAGAGVGIGAILPLQFRVQLFIQYSYFHFMLHCLGLLLGKWQFSFPAMETVPQFFSYIYRREKKPPWFPMAATTPYSMAMRFFCGSCLCGTLGIEMRKNAHPQTWRIDPPPLPDRPHRSCGCIGRCTAPGGDNGLFHPARFYPGSWRPQWSACRSPAAPARPLF